MPQSVGTVTSTLILDTRRAEAAYKRFEQKVARGRGRDNLFGSISADAKDFENSLGKATNRVVAFGAAAAVFTTLARAATEFARSIIEVDASLAKINVNLGQSQQGLKQFGSDLFNIARQTGQTFEVTAKAAEELARQGLGAQETTKRLKDSLILSRIASIDSAEAVETLTAAINSFNESALTSTEVVNKFAAVDTKFAVSSNDLAQAISRVGSTAQSAGVGINELIGLVTSLQQTTARGGATIGNGLKTIFTRIQAAPETVSALEGIGVAIKNTDGSLRDAVSILRDYGVAREKVGEAERAALDRTVAGTFQINILKAALTDLTRQYSVYDSAVQTANQATDEAIRKNEQLNQTLSSLINSTAVTIKQFFASVGQQDIGPILST
jgi:TP901 family phage tail tape measure protein